MAKYPFLAELSTFEGVLFPDTYRIRQGAKLDEFLGTLLSVFNDRIYSKLTQIEKKDFYQTLILASIVEREERNPEQKATVA